MKKVLSFTLLCFTFYHAHSQHNERIKGIYKTANDFIENKLSFPVDCKQDDNRIRLNDFFNKAYVTITYQDSTYKFLKKDLYGYQLCNGNIWRFQNKQELLSLNKNEPILIYLRELPKTTKGKTNVTNYYFSKSPGDSLHSLTIKNLLATFAGNKKFQEFIIQNFKYNTDLADFDEAGKTYKIVEILNSAQE